MKLLKLFHGQCKMENLEKNTNSNVDHIKKMFFWRTAFFGLIILVAGIAIGGASMSIFASRKITHKPEPREYNSLLPRLAQILSLQQQQVNKIKPIIDENMQHLYEIREDARTEIADTLEKMNNEIYPLLSDIQKRRWSSELIRIQREIDPEPGRNQQGGNRRRGTSQHGQEEVHYGRSGQRIGTRRGMVFQPSLAAPNSPQNSNENIIENDSFEYLKPEDMNQ